MTLLAALILLALVALVAYLIVCEFSRAFSQAQRFANGECDCSRHRVCAVCLASLRKEGS